jgi:chromosome partitioning protein
MLEGNKNMSGKVVSFINMKGGVGKTTLCIGIGEYLANYCNKKVLFIDLDPQFNTTQSLVNEFNLEDEYLSNYSEGTNQKTVMRLFETQQTIAKRLDLPNPEDILVHLNDNMDLLPGTIDLILVETDKDGSKAKKVKKFILNNNLKDQYDFIFLDCPPTISVYTDAALIASDFYLVPIRIDRYSILGIKLLKQVIDRLDDNESIGIRPLGIVYTMVKDLTHKTLQLKATFESTEIVQEIGLFENMTSNVNDLLVGLQGNIASKYKKSREDISAICKEFLERIEKYDA